MTLHPRRILGRIVYHALLPLDDLLRGRLFDGFDCLERRLTQLLNLVCLYFTEHAPAARDGENPPRRKPKNSALLAPACVEPSQSIDLSKLPRLEGFVGFKPAGNVIEDAGELLEEIRGPRLGREGNGDLGIVRLTSPRAMAIQAPAHAAQIGLAASSRRHRSLHRHSPTRLTRRRR